MKTLILYTSQTGFTKQYADWIAEKTEGEVLPLTKVIKKPESFFDEYDAIVYGGWAMGGKIVKSEWFMEHVPLWSNKKLALFCCGATPQESPDIQPFLDSLFTIDQEKYAKAFYCQGGVNYKKMKLFSKLAMKAFVSMLKNKADKSQKEIDMMNMLSESYDITDRKYADAISDYLLGK